MWLSNWLLAVTIASQLGDARAVAASAAPEPIAMRQSMFAIPFRIDQANDPTRQVAEAQLYVSTDRGAHWRLYAKAQPTQQHFLFRAGADGEYWFAIRTVDRSGQARPEMITEPGLRVRIDTKPANVAVAPKTPPQTQNVDKPIADAAPATISDAKGSVVVAIAPAVGKKYVAAGEPSDGPAISGLPPGERPRMVNSRLFELEYDVDSVGPSGIGRVELWGTRDGGQTWRSFTVDSDNRSPLPVTVEEEGVYGFCVVVTNGAGFGGKPPKAGDLPDLWVGVDLTRPTARIVSAQQGVDGEAGHLIVSWQADDKMLAARPVSLSFSESRDGPWLPIASGLENTGRYAWPIDGRTPSQLYLRLEVRDEAGNVAMHDASEPVKIDQSRPTIRLRDIRAVGQTSARPAN
jgi:hypothetical protein